MLYLPWKKGEACAFVFFFFVVVVVVVVVTVVWNYSCSRAEEKTKEGRRVASGKATGKKVV